jgi:tetratricopeptide (TPR) repeat protein
VYTLLIAAIAGIATATGLINAWDHNILSVLAGMIVFLLVMVLTGLIFRKKIQAIFEAASQRVLASRDEVQRQVRLMQAKNMTGGKSLQKQLENKQAEGIREAVAMMDALKPYERWNLLVTKQANTFRANNYYQIRDYENADKCFENILPLRLMPEPLIAAMRMARLWKTDRAKEMEAYFKKAVKSYKDEKCALLYALYSWILVKEKRIDEAIVLLNEGKEKAENETLRQNWEHLVNDRTRRFSNAAFGDEWYALLLEEPKQARATRQGRFGQKMRRR